MRNPDIKDIARVGIVYEDNDTKNLQFVHSTLAEFYVAKFLANEINRLSCQANNPSSEEDAKLLTDILLEHPGPYHEHLQFIFLDDMLKAKLAQGLSYTNFPEFNDDEGRLEDYLKFHSSSEWKKRDNRTCSYLEDFLVNTVNSCDLDFMEIVKCLEFRLSRIYAHGLERFAWLFSLLRKMSHDTLKFREIEWIFLYDATGKNITSQDITRIDLALDSNPSKKRLVSINDMIKIFDKHASTEFNLKKCIMLDPIAYIFFTDENREKFFNFMENYVPGKSFSPELMALPYSDKVNTFMTTSEYYISVDKSLIKLIEDRSGLYFSEEEKYYMRYHA